MVYTADSYAIMSVMKRTDIDSRKDEIIKRLEAGETRASICRWLNCKEITLQVRLKKWKKEHLKNPGRRGQPHNEQWHDINKYLKDGSTIQSFKLKNALFRSGLKKKKCEYPGCGLTEWLGKPAPLELDHINGKPHDNRIENLRILCPNCHAQTSTYRARNKRKCGELAELVDASSLRVDDQQ